MLIHTTDSTGDIYFIEGIIKKFDVEKIKLSDFLTDEIYEDFKKEGYEVYIIKDLISNWNKSEIKSLWYNKETNSIKYIEVKKTLDGTIKRYVLEDYDTFDSDLTLFERMILENFYFDQEGKKLEKYPIGIGRYHLELNSQGVSKEYFEENKYKFGFIDYVTGERFKKKD